MKKKDFFSIQMLLWYLLITILLLFITSWFVPKQFAEKIILIFSSDGLLNKNTVDNTLAHAKKILFFLLFVNIAVIAYFKIDLFKITALIQKIIAFINFTRIKKRVIFHKNSLMYFLLFLILIFYFFQTTRLANKMDIGTDEGYYISLVKNYYDGGKFSLNRYNFAEFRNQGLLYPFILLKPLTNFDYRLTRYISIFYSLVLFSFLFLIIKQKASLFAALLFSIFLLFDRTYLFISSSAFIELPAILFLTVGIYLYTKYNGFKTNILASVFFALAMLSKMQVIPFLFASLFILGYKTKDERLKTIIVLGTSSLLFFLFAFLFTSLQGFSPIETVKSIYRITGSSGEITSSLPFANRLSHINNYFNIIYLSLIAFISVFIIRNFKKEDKFIQVIFVFSLINSFWWIFSFTSIAPRNLLYSLVFLYFLASIYIAKLVKINASSYSKYYLPLLLVFLGLHIINNLAFIHIEGRKGISDETLLTLNGYREPFGDGKDVIQSGQIEFYNYIENSIPANALIYWISSDSNKDLFTKRVFLPPSKNFIFSKFLPQNSYFLLTYIDYKNKYVTDSLLIYLNKNASLLFKKNYWEVYRIE